MTKDIEKEIMSQIKKDEIKIKSRWVFIARKLGLQSGLALTVVVLIFLINAFFYYIKTNEILLPLHYGPAVWQKFLHSLPYDLILLIIIFLVFLNYIIKKFDFSYKKSFMLILTVLIIFTIVWASILFSSNFNNLLRSKLEREAVYVPFITDFYIRRCGDCCR